MSLMDRDERPDEDLVFEFDLDAPPEKVWRAVTIAEFRERWLPGSALADPEPVLAVAGEEVRYRMRDDDPPFLESTVTFHVQANGAGGTRFRIVHQLCDERVGRPVPVPANSNGGCLMRAA